MPPRGNPFGRGVAPAPELNVAARLEAPPRVPETDLPNRTAGMGTLADRLDALSAQAFKRADEATAATAWEAGLVAAEKNPGVQMEGGGAVYRDAFNRAATSMGLNRLEVAGRTALDRLAEQHPTDAGAFGTAAQAYRDGAAADLPAGLKARFLVSFDAWARPYLDRVTDQTQKFVTNQAAATFSQASELRQVARDRAAMGAATGDRQATQDLLREDQNYLNDLITQGPKQAFTLDGQEYPADETRLGTFSPLQMQKLWSAWQKSGRHAAFRGQYEAAPDKEAWLREFERQNIGAGGGSGGDPAEPRGIRNNNPLNLSFLPGQGASGSDGRFGVYPTMEAGIAAAHQQLLLNQDRGLNTLAKQINRWAPPSENDTGRYIAAVAKATGLDPNAPIDLRDPAIAGKVIGAMAQVENGKPLDPATIDRALNGDMGKPTDRAPGRGSAGLALDEAMGLAREFRADIARRAREMREAQQSERVRLDPLVRGNLEAASRGLPIPHDITDDEFRAAGLDPGRKRAELAMQQNIFAARTELDNANTPERIQLVADQFAPGTAAFMLDPKAAGQVLDWARQRGAQIQHAGLEERIRDLTTQAEGTGANVAITTDEGRAAGMRPEQIAAVNASLALKADLYRRFQERLRMSPAEAAAAEAALPIEGPEAAENRARLQAYAQAAQAQRAGLAKDPAGYVVNVSKPAQELMAQAGQDPQAMRSLIDLTLAEQARMGVPEADRRPLPDELVKRAVTEIASLPTDMERIRRMNQFLAPVQQEEHRSAVLGQMQGAGLKEHLVVGAAIALRGGLHGGEALGGRIATELGTDTAKMGITGDVRKSVTTDTTSVWDSDSRLGGLRRAQALVAGAPIFAQQGEHEQRLLEKVALARNAGTGTYDAREIYAQMYGGRVIVNRPREGVLVAAPEGTDPDRLTAGLMQLRRERLAGLGGSPAQLRALEDQGVWVDHGAGRYALYMRGMGGMMPGPDKQPIIVSTADALAAQDRAGATPRQMFQRARRAQWGSRGGVIEGFAAEDTEGALP